MVYNLLATARTPALIVYLLDASASMTNPLGNRSRMQVVGDALIAAVRQMVFRSTRGGRISPRYRIAMFAYSDRVYDLLGGAQSVDEVARRGVPELSPLRTTDTAAGFDYVEHFLGALLPSMPDCPAPLVCHMTDGEYTGADPEPIARRIMGMETSDGPVLIENIFISDRVLTDPVEDPRQWPGVTHATPLASDYAGKLRSMSSRLPDSYRALLLENGYRFAPDAHMLLPGDTPEMVSLGFQMSAATPVR